MRLADGRWLVVVFALLFVAGAAGRAVSKPLWHDEIFTLYLATATTLDGLWDALAGGADLNPPLYHLAVRASAAAAGAGAFATRLPALAGFLIASLALYAFVTRRLGPVFALVAAVVPSLTGVYLYAYEGRPYGLVLGLSALALVAWQIRGEGPSHPAAPVACAAMLAAAVFTHYYAILMVIPLAAGELARTLVRRRIDWPMVLAMAFALAPLVLLRPLVESARRFAPTFWSRPAPGELVEFYRQLLDPLSLFFIAAALCMSVAGLWYQARGARRGAALTRVEERARSLRPDEIVAALALVMLPAIGYALAVFVTGAFHGRYVLQSVLGLAILVAWWSAAVVRMARDAAILVAVLFLAFGARQAGGTLALVREAPDPLADHRPALSGLPDDAPVVVSHALAFLPMVHYSTPGTAHRLTYLTRPPDVVQQLGVDTGGRALRRLAEIAPLGIEDYDTFVAAHDRFYVYGPRSWLIPKLLSEAGDVRLLRDSDQALLYAVTLPR